MLLKEKTVLLVEFLVPQIFYSKRMEVKSFFKTELISF